MLRCFTLLPTPSRRLGTLHRIGVSTLLRLAMCFLAHCLGESLGSPICRHNLCRTTVQPACPPSVSCQREATDAVEAPRIARSEICASQHVPRPLDPPWLPDCCQWCRAAGPCFIALSIPLGRMSLRLHLSRPTTRLPISGQESLGDWDVPLRRLNAPFN